MHSILKFVFLEIQNKAIRPVLSGPATYAKLLINVVSGFGRKSNLDLANLLKQLNCINRPF